jgi:hypothetical protein
MNKHAVFAVNTKIPFGETGHNDVSSKSLLQLFHIYLCIRYLYVIESTVFRETIGLNRRDSRQGVSTVRNAVAIEFRREFFFFQQRAKILEFN